MLKPDTIAAFADTRFHFCLAETMLRPGFLENYDRLRGTNLCMKGSPIDLMVDIAAGRIEGEVAEFVDFVCEYVYRRVPPSSDGDPGAR